MTTWSKSPRFNPRNVPMPDELVNAKRHTEQPRWDETGNCVVESCGHHQSEHAIRGCKHKRGEADTCWCAVSGAA